jgi:hypothetical protein
MIEKSVIDSRDYWQRFLATWPFRGDSDLGQGFSYIDLLSVKRYFERRPQRLFHPC